MWPAGLKGWPWDSRICPNGFLSLGINGLLLPDEPQFPRPSNSVGPPRLVSGDRNLTPREGVRAGPPVANEEPVVGGAAPGGGSGLPGQRWPRGCKQQPGQGAGTAAGGGRTVPEPQGTHLRCSLPTGGRLGATLRSFLQVGRLRSGPQGGCDVEGSSGHRIGRYRTGQGGAGRKTAQDFAGRRWTDRKLGLW